MFIAHGLARGAFISTEAVASLAVYLSKTAVFQAYGALPADNCPNCAMPVALLAFILLA